MAQKLNAAEHSGGGGNGSGGGGEQGQLVSRSLATGRNANATSLRRGPKLKRNRCWSAQDNASRRRTPPFSCQSYGQSTLSNRIVRRHVMQQAGRAPAFLLVLVGLRPVGKASWLLPCGPWCAAGRRGVHMLRTDELGDAGQAGGAQPPAGAAAAAQNTCRRPCRLAQSADLQWPSAQLSTCGMQSREAFPAHSCPALQSRGLLSEVAKPRLHQQPHVCCCWSSQGAEGVCTCMMQCSEEPRVGGACDATDGRLDWRVRRLNIGR